MLALPADIIVPLTTDADGVIRVGNTRVSFETVIAAFKQGDSPQQIADDFDVLLLADVFAVITYYLQHQTEVDDYILNQDRKSANIRRDIETHHPKMLAGQAKLRALLNEKKSE